MSTILIAIRPQYVDRILNGTKRFEFRKRSSGVRVGDELLIYCTNPTSAILATCIVHRVLVGSPSKLYSTVNGSSGISRREFREYYAGHKTAYALELSEVQLFRASVPLRRLRERIAGFVVPRSYRFMTPDELAAIRRDVR